MIVVRHMSSLEEWNPMQGKMEEEEETVVDEERSNKLQHKPSAGRYLRWQGSYQLEGR